MEGEAGGRKIALANTYTVRRVEVRFADLSLGPSAAVEARLGDRWIVTLLDRPGWILPLLALLALAASTFALARAFRRRPPK